LNQNLKSNTCIIIAKDLNGFYKMID